MFNVLPDNEQISIQLKIKNKFEQRQTKSSPKASILSLAPLRNVRVLCFVHRNQPEIKEKLGN